MPVFSGKRCYASGLVAVLAILSSPTGAEGVGPGDARAPSIVVDRAVCRALPRHVPAPDVAYQPGVDAQGRAVAPADLPPADLAGSGGAADTAAALGLDRIQIDLTRDLAGRFGIPVDSLYRTEAYIGLVTVENGRVTLNGNPLGPVATEELVLVCRRQGGS